MPKSRRKSVRKSKKQKMYNMKGCSKKGLCTRKNKKVKNCSKCGPGCKCGPNCNCPPNCPGNCSSNSMYGGSGCGSCGCPIAPLPYKDMLNYQKGGKPIGQNGGNCASCQAINVVQNGGNWFKPPTTIPGPFVGQAWGPNKLPGMDGISGNRNYLASIGKVINSDPTRQMSMNDAGYLTKNSMVGGYEYKTSNSNIGTTISESSSNTNSNSNELLLNNKKLKRKTINKSKAKRGGGLLPQDLVNLGRDVSFNFKSVSNALNGYPKPISDLPYQDQFPNSNKL